MIEDLYNKCIAKIDDDDIEIAEFFLVGCVTLLKRRYTGRADRDRVRDDFQLIRGWDKYERELNTIAKLSDDALSSLIASSIDLTYEVRHINDLFNKIKDASMDKKEAIKQSSQALKASKMLKKIADILRPRKKKITNKKPVKKKLLHKNIKFFSTKSLFDGME